MLDARKEFPWFAANPGVCYLDSAATAMTCYASSYVQTNFELHHKSNVYRGAYPASMRATDLYDEARATVAKFIGAIPREIVFVRNATEALNLAAGLCRSFVGGQCVALTTAAEHHSNFLPWRWNGAFEASELNVVPCDPDGRITPDAVRRAACAGRKPDVFAFHHVSNVTGFEADVKDLVYVARNCEALTVCDASQSVPHMPIDVHDLGVDMLAFSGHKMCAPMGIGVLYIRKALADQLDPLLTGGGMIARWDPRVGETWEQTPYRFEAGTPNVSGALALATACHLYWKLDWDVLRKHEFMLMERLVNGLLAIPEVAIVGSKDPKEHCGCVSFLVKDMNANLVGRALGEKNVCVRSGYHCAIPFHDAVTHGEPTCRASTLFYNTEEDIDQFLTSLKEVIHDGNPV